MNVLRIAALGPLGAIAVATACAIDSRSVTVAAVGAGGGTTEAGAGGPAGQTDAGRGAGATGQLMICEGMPPKRELITDFSDARPGTNLQGNPDIEFEAAYEIGEVFTYHSPELEPPRLSLEPRADGQALRVTATPETPISAENNYFGFGLGWGAVDHRDCLDASGYNGVKFSIEGNLSTCQLSFGVNFSQDTDVTLNSAGSCALESECHPPQSGTLSPNTGSIEVLFDQMSGGNPVRRVDRKTIIGVNWLLSAPLNGAACEASFSVDDVAFFR